MLCPVLVELAPCWGRCSGCGEGFELAGVLYTEMDEVLASLFGVCGPLEEAVLDCDKEYAPLCCTSGVSPVVRRVDDEA